jgi:hypothetical protein
MNTLTHALLPVLAARPLLTAGLGHPTPRRREFFLIGVAGALPDVLNPHLSLAARLASWSHAAWCWLAFTAVVLAVARLRPGWLAPRVAWLMSGAYLLHQACDAISGGVAWLNPWSRVVVGGRWVPFAWWIPLDAVLLFATYLVFRCWPRWRDLRTKNAARPPQT